MKPDNSFIRAAFLWCFKIHLHQLYPNHWPRNIFLNIRLCPKQVTLLCGGPIKRCTQWSEKTLAKAFDLRLNCGDRAYKYLLEQGYPLPSLKTMQRHIRSVEVKLQHPEATFITTSQEDSDGETVELHHEDLQHSQQQHHIIPVQHAYLQQFGNQQIIKASWQWDTKGMCLKTLCHNSHF